VAQVQKMDPGCSIQVTGPDQLFHEAKITVRFWIVTIILAALTIITLKIR
jgi:phospho-N-acetylmuramoyl-pentapeptide-transferase